MMSIFSANPSATSPCRISALAAAVARAAAVFLLVFTATVPAQELVQQELVPQELILEGSGVAAAQVATGRHGMVATQEQQATRIGLDILKRGGNAVDAAVAIGFTLAVTLPKAGNIGGGGFMLVHTADRNENTAIDYREAAPVATTVDVFLGPDQQADPAKSRDSGLGVGGPGTVAGVRPSLGRFC